MSTAAEMRLDRLIKSRSGLFGVLFGIILIFNFQYLVYPPFWDEIMGLHNQALYLAGHNFDFFSLWQEDQGYMAGGSCVYPLGILPWVYAVLYRALPPVAVHVAGHLINIAALAFAGTLFIRLLRRFCPVSLALLWGLVGLTEPILTGQMASQGQEAVLAAFIMLSVYLFFAGKWRMAIAVGAASCFIKFAGVVILPAFSVYFLYLAVTGDGKERRRYLIYGLSTLILTLVLYLFFRLAGFSEDSSSGIFNLGIMLVFQQVKYYYPWIAVKLAIVIIGFAVIFFRKKSVFYDDSEYFFLLILIIGYFAAYFVAPFPQLPRYTVIVVLPLALLLAHVMKYCSERTAMITAMLFFGLQMVNQNGMLLPSPGPYLAADPAILERSREFLKVVEMDMRMASELEKNAPDIELVCKIPYPQILTMPALGYVKKALPNIRVYGLAPQYCSARPIGIMEITENTMLLYAANSMDSWIRPAFIPNRTCKIYYIDENASRVPDLVIFSGLRFITPPGRESK